MLVLTRKIGEKITIGDDISFVILGVKGCQVKVGIDAPKDVAVHREEIKNKILKKKENLSGMDTICS